MTLRNDHVELTFDPQSGALVSLRDVASGAELLRDQEGPKLLWKLAFRHPPLGDLQWLTSDEASQVVLDETRGEGETSLTIAGTGLPGPVAEVVVRIALPDDSPLSRWRVEARGVAADAAVCQIICPLVAGLVKLGDPAPGECLVSPIQSEGYLFCEPFPVRDHLPLCAGAGPEMAEVGVGGIGGRYPGQIALQLLACYNDHVGLYFAAHDAGQHPKELNMRVMAGTGPAPVMSMTHLCSEIPGADVAPPYDAIVGLFHGDWYAAADIYKAWATRQWWCEQKLWDRDIASWLREGVGGVWQMSNYHIPRLDLNHSADLIADTVNDISRRAGVPLLGLLFNWEQGGAWTGPKGFFPPREGEAEFRAAMAKLCEAGNHGFVYVTGHNWYVRIAYDPVWDSWPEFRAEGEALALRKPDGEYTVMSWYGGWEVVRLCPAPPAAVPLHADIVTGCLKLGCDVVQIDNFPCGGSEACYDPAHGHPPGHGPWWSEACIRMLTEIRRQAKALNPDCALTTEGVSENFIPWLDLFDQRAGNMEYFGHYGRGLPMGGETIPLFSYVYNEYLGAYYAAMPECNRPEVLYWTRGIGKAICQGVLPSAGRYFPDPPDSNPVTLAFFERIVRATGRELYPYLMFGEMLRPPDIEVPAITAQYCKFVYDAENCVHRQDPQQRHEVTDRAVQHAAYRGRDGSVCLLFVNVSEEPVSFDVELPAYDLQGPVQVETIANSVAGEALADVPLPHATALRMEPLSITLLIMREA